MGERIRHAIRLRALPNTPHTSPASNDGRHGLRRALMTAVRVDGALDHNWEMPFGGMSGAMGGTAAGYEPRDPPRSGRLRRATSAHRRMHAPDQSNLSAE
jgi:hypothetical protein